MRNAMGAGVIAVVVLGVACDRPEPAPMATDGPGQVVLSVPSMT